MKTPEEYAVEWSLKNNNDTIDKQDFKSAIREAQTESHNHAIDVAIDYATAWISEDDNKAYVFVQSLIKLKL